MRLTFLNYPDPLQPEHWAEAMRQSGSPANIGNNPFLPVIISNTWRWPYIAAGFYIEDRLVAWISAVKIRNKWVSLPHFDHGSLWTDWDYLNSITKPHDKKSEKFFHQFILSLFHDYMNTIKKPVNTSRHIRVDMDTSEFTGAVLPGKWQKSTHMEIRSKFPLMNHQLAGKVIPMIQLGNYDSNQLDGFSGNVRRKIRKSAKNGIETLAGKEELLNDFYQIYRNNIHQLGSFALPFRFFKNLLTQYKRGAVYIVLAKIGTEVVGASILITYLRFAENAWFASLKEFNRFYVTYALHHKMIGLSVSNHCDHYSFGRSTTNSSVHRFKQQWGTCDEQLFFNSTKSRIGLPVKCNYVHHFIKNLPLGLVRIFDEPVSRLLY
jgi:hypothetical protein